MVNGARNREGVLVLCWPWMLDGDDERAEKILGTVCVVVLMVRAGERGMPGCVRKRCWVDQTRVEVMSPPLVLARATNGSRSSAFKIKFSEFDDGNLFDGVRSIVCMHIIDWFLQLTAQNVWNPICVFRGVGSFL